MDLAGGALQPEYHIRIIGMLRYGMSRAVKIQNELNLLNF